MALHPVEFTINVTGELSEENLAGKFKARPVLSLSQQLDVDRIRRELLGPNSNPDVASARAQNVATIFAELAIRIVDAPSWWKENGNGVGLLDDNVVKEVYDAAMDIEKRHVKAIRDRAEQAKKDLERVA